MITQAEKDAAVALLDAEIPARQTLRGGKYIQVLEYSPDRVHTLSLDEYVGPRGAGYIRRCRRMNAGGAIWEYQDHHGPETERDAANGWQEVTPIV